MIVHSVPVHSPLVALTPGPVVSRLSSTVDRRTVGRPPSPSACRLVLVEKKESPRDSAPGEWTGPLLRSALPSGARFLAPWGTVPVPYRATGHGVLAVSPEDSWVKPSHRGALGRRPMPSLSRGGRVAAVRVSAVSVDRAIYTKGRLTAIAGGLSSGVSWGTWWEGCVRLSAVLSAVGRASLLSPFVRYVTSGTT